MKKYLLQLRISSFVLSIIFLFLLLDFFAYIYITHSIEKNYEQEKKILFYQIQTQTADLLSELLHQYIQKKDTILQTHNIVKAYLEKQNKDPLSVNLEKIFQQINAPFKKPLYNIYVANEQLIIQNTTFPPDKGFDLSFAKETFQKHYRQHTIGLSTPLLERTSQQFFSYSDEYINNKHRLLQISYTFPTQHNTIQKIQKSIASATNIVDAQAYLLLNDGFINKIPLQKREAKKIELQEIIQNTLQGEKILQSVHTEGFKEQHFVQNKKSYTIMYIMVQNPILPNAKALYTITTDDTQVKNRLSIVLAITIVVSVLGIVAILLITSLRRKELQLDMQKNFVQAAMHELKTPLSIIMLNNEMRSAEQGSDEYTAEIDNALKILQTSYEDMSYAITKHHNDYEVLSLPLYPIVQERVAYFQTIAKSDTKQLHLIGTSDCTIKISYIELVRIIDNTLSNALKYSDPKTTITIYIKNNKLCIKNKGKTIHNTQKIFSQFVREDKIKGGYGLGLYIVDTITKKHNIIIEVDSHNSNTTFCYTHQCTHQCTQGEK